jgi:RimJ/RimL family protein N-acetyltransferase
VQLVTPRLVLPPIDDAYLADMRSGQHQPHWADDFPTATDSMLAGLYEQAGVPRDDRAQLFAHRLVIEKDSGLVVGGIGVKGPPRDGAVEIGYGVVASRQRRGYAGEAVAALLAALWAEPDVRTVLAEVDPGNTASVRVLLRTGFTRTGGGGYDRYCVHRPAAV